MARTTTEIYDDISLEVQNQPQLNELQPQIDDAQTLLSDLTSSSKVADWRLWKWVMAAVISSLENLWDIFKAEVDVTVEAARWGTLPWWQAKALDFQYGYSLQFVDRKFQYATLDEAAQIIKRSAAVESNRQVILKVAKEDTNSDPVKLATDELTAFQSFVSKIRPPGTNTLVVSYDPDLLKLSYTVYYDPAILDSSGQLLSDPSQKPVETAIEDYIKNIVWNGAFNIQKATDAIQAAIGVVDIVAGNQEIKAAAATSYKGFYREVISTAGYMIIDPLYPLPNQINYVVNA